MKSPNDVVEIAVDSSDAGARLDVFAARHIPSLSRAKIQSHIESGLILRNGRPAKKKTALAEGDIVSFDKARLSASAASRLVPQNIPLDVLYEDDYLLAVNKPPGMVVHPGSGNREGTLVHALLYHVKSLSAGFAPDRPGIVHRLDKDTSGVLLVAKTDQTHRKLARLFSSREIKKEYLGFCIGKRPQAHASLGAPLGRSRRDPVKRAVRGDGKEALTEYWLLTNRCGISMMKFAPHTGRTHQIRVHCSAAGFPVLADSLYGGGKDALGRIPVLERPFAASVFKCFDRHALHAHTITFVHPHTNREQTISAPLPGDFRKAAGLFENDGGKLSASFHS
ncbi:MAG TPA: RluA family pseudouridine synthase [Chitinivibrionales bacterium]|nr:RluA family pseudouridine synthase [Chitinivibrionales bacterium]